MQTIGAFEAKTHFSALLEKVMKGEEVIITKRGNPIAKLIAFDANPNLPDKKTTIAKLLEFSNDNYLKGLNWKSLRDQGRK